MPSLATPRPLLRAIKKQVGKVKVSLRSQGEALEELFQLFTSERQHLKRFSYMNDPRLRLAYLRYHLPLNTVRSICVLKDLLKRYPAIAETEWITDMGAGPGSSTIASLLTLPADRTRRYLLTDQSRGALRVAREIFEECAPAEKDGVKTSITTLQQKLPMLPRFQGPTLVWMSMVVNEFDHPERRGIDIKRFFNKLAEKLPPGSTVVIIEPGLRQQGRRLLALHDSLLESQRWEILAPCTHQKTCPLLSEPKRPWCHFHFRWQPGDIVKQIAVPLGLTAGKGSMSYLAMQPAKEGGLLGNRNPELARVIGDPMDVRHTDAGIYLCQDGKRRVFRNPPKETTRGALLERGRQNRDARLVAPWPGGSPERKHPRRPRKDRRTPPEAPPEKPGET